MTTHANYFFWGGREQSFHLAAFWLLFFPPKRGAAPPPPNTEHPACMSSEPKGTQRRWARVGTGVGGAGRDQEVGVQMKRVPVGWC